MTESEDPRERIASAKRLGVERCEWMDAWWTSWSPRNNNQNAEGAWEDWVQLAHDILAADADWRAQSEQEAPDVS